MKQEKKPEKIIELLKKVKALADGGATPGERQAAQNRLDHLMKEYNITGDELRVDDEVEHELKYKFDKMTADIIYGVVRAYTNESQERFSMHYSKRTAKALGYNTYYKLMISRRHFIDIDVAIKYYLNAFKTDLKPVRKEHLKKKKQQLRRQELDREKMYWADEKELSRSHRIARGNLTRKFKKEIDAFCDAFRMKHKLYRLYKNTDGEDGIDSPVENSDEAPIKEAGRKPLSLAEIKRFEKRQQEWLKARDRINSKTLKKPIDLLNEENPLMLTN